MIEAKITGLKRLYDAVGAYDKQSRKALKTAVQVEGFKRLRQLRDEMKAGKPGGKAFKPLGHLAGRTKTGALKKNQVPLYRLTRLLRYRVDYDSSGNFSLSFGFVNTNKARLSNSYKELLIKHQEGIEVLYTKSRSELGRRFARIGGKLKKKGDPDARFFFLKKTTGKKIDLPERGIIDPFYRANQNAIWRNIRSNFQKKMRGERI